MKTDCLFVANIPGSFNAIFPIIKEAQKENLRFHCYIVEYGKKILLDECLPYEIVNENSSDTIRSLLKKVCPKILITGSAIPQINMGQTESLFIQEASKLKIFSVTILDFWEHYRLRFSLSGGEFLDALPNIICATDTLMKKGLVQAGIPSEIIRITGNPYLEQLRNKGSFLQKKGKSFFRKQFGFSDDDIVITLSSQPLREDFGMGQYGFDENTVFKDLLQVLSEAKWYRNVKLIWKPHPREKKSISQNYYNFGINIRLFGNEDTHELMIASDLIIGATTMQLVEAHIMGCNSISYQPTDQNHVVFPFQIRVLKNIGSLRKFLNSQTAFFQKPKKFFSNEINHKPIQAIKSIIIKTANATHS